MRGFDAFAGVIKSGGKTRRAAKMVILNVDHPDIEDFIECKAKEELKAWTLMQAGYDGSGPDSEAYSSIFFQNANNSVRVNDDFMRAVERDQDFTTRKVKGGEPAKVFKARDLMRKIAEATWQCGDPGMQYDTTINKWHTSKNSGRINASNPCSEYMFLDDSACNLASFNLLKFITPAAAFDVEAYRHAIDILITAMDILVDNAGYPTESIVRNSHDYRPLGLGYANLGALLMAMGLPYDSDAGRDFAAALTAIMCGQSYLQSSVLAEKAPALVSATALCQQAQYADGGLAQRGGACPGFYVNREPFLDVIRMHRAEVNKIGHINSSEPFTTPQLASLIAASKDCWDQALAHGEQHGYRNSQVTVLAPTGTIGFMMDCDTTGIEPDLALVKYKKLVGGGMIKIVNNTVPVALFKLGYTNPQVDSIVSYIDSTGTIEGAPGIKPEHLAVFDCSFKPSKGTRSIHSSGHIKMMAAAQPFLSGAISKTVNLPHDATLDDIIQAYTEAWRLGLKAVAVYRDGSKGAQPLNVSDGNKAKVIKNALGAETNADVAVSAAANRVLTAMAQGDTTSVGDDLRVLEDKVSARLEVTANAVLTAANAFSASIANAVTLGQAAAQREDQDATQGPPRAVRHRLPEERPSLTHKFSIAGHEGYITVGLYPNGQPGEIFIKMAKEGSTVSGLMDSFATAVSLSLQHGVPLKVLCEKFAHTRFEPSGWTGNEHIGFAKSIMDYIFRWLQLRFLSGHQLSLFTGLASGAQLPPAEETPSEAGRYEVRYETRPPSSGILPEAGSPAQGGAGGSMEDRGIYGMPETRKGAPIFHAADAMKEYIDMGDAPSCHTCGAIMVRNGSCYRCMSCGSTSGCS
jgi:ribonucleoside-diphosphate reductase alpha chain